VRSLIERHLASNRRVVPTWRYVRQKLDEAARGGDAMDLAVALQIALHLEGVECQAEAALVSAALDGREQAQSFNAHVANQACTMLHRPSRENRCRTDCARSVHTASRLHVV
jgi:hypothetical protein